MKRILNIAILLVLISVLVSCAGISEPASSSSNIVPDSSAPDSSTNQPGQDDSSSAAEVLDEPPLQEEDWAVAVPDFLTEEQQILYRRAHNLYLHTYLGSDIEYAGNAPDLSQYETVQIDSYSYYVSQGPYRNWEDFRAVMCSVFTEDYWNRFIGNTSLKDHDGRLCFLDTSLGLGYFYDKTSTDTFRLESQSDTEICFTLIGHYAGAWIQGETNPTGEALHRYTLEFPMRLVLTENGWRFEEFHSALLEEQYPYDAEPVSALADEPPLQEADLAISVPDFLTEEQQTLYRRAYSLYRHMFGGDTSSIDYTETLDTYNSPIYYDETIQIGQYSYTKSQGRYQQWRDFDAVVHSVFTENFWSQINQIENGTKIYAEYDEMLYFLDLSRGSGLQYNENFMDEFVLIEKLDSEILFTLIGHYSDALHQDGETLEEYDARRRQSYDYIQEFPIKMVLTQNGWRFDEFHSALADE